MPYYSNIRSKKPTRFALQRQKIARRQTKLVAELRALFLGSVYFFYETYLRVLSTYLLIHLLAKTQRNIFMLYNKKINTLLNIEGKKFSQSFCVQCNIHRRIIFKI